MNRDRCPSPVSTIQLRRLIHERIREWGRRPEFHFLFVIFDLSGLLLPNRDGFRFAVGSPPPDAFGEIDAMDIMEVQFYLQDGWESLETFRSRMWVFGGFAAFQPSDVFVNMCFPFFLIGELLHPGRCRKYGIP